MHWRRTVPISGRTCHKPTALRPGRSPTLLCTSPGVRVVNGLDCRLPTATSCSDTWQTEGDWWSKKRRRRYWATSAKAIGHVIEMAPNVNRKQETKRERKKQAPLATRRYFYRSKCQSRAKLWMLHKFPNGRSVWRNMQRSDVAKKNWTCAEKKMFYERTTRNHDYGNLWNSHSWVDREAMILDIRSLKHNCLVTTAFELINNVPCNWLLRSMTNLLAQKQMIPMYDRAIDRSSHLASGFQQFLYYYSTQYQHRRYG